MPSTPPDDRGIRGEAGSLPIHLFPTPLPPWPAASRAVSVIAAGLAREQACLVDIAASFQQALTCLPAVGTGSAWWQLERDPSPWHTVQSFLCNISIPLSRPAFVTSSS